WIARRTRPCTHARRRADHCVGRRRCSGDDEGPGAHGVRRRMALRRRLNLRRPLSTRKRMSMDASAVAEYLKQNPAFFEDYADVVAQIFVPHPHGGHAIPIAERQMLALRDKVYDLEQKLRELIAHGADNDLIGEKLHRATLALFAARDLETTLAVLSHSLKEDFGVPQVATRLWPEGGAGAALPDLADTPAEIREYADRLRAPYCGPEPVARSREWFD